MNRCLAAALGLLLIVAGCGGSAGPAPGDNQEPVATDGGVHTRVLRDASGLPKGVQVTWGKVEGASAYHLYRSSSPIPDSARGDSGFMVSISGDTLIPNPPNGLTAFADDIHPVTIGETWFYRVSAINQQSEESLLSEEAQITISPFQVLELLDLSVRVGETFRVRGINFGSYDPATDSVRVHGVVWDNKLGFVPSMLDCSVVDWTPSRITATLPLGATNGEVEVSINGDAQETPEVLDNADPYIESLTPLSGDVTNQLILDGAHFGVGPSIDNRVVFDGSDPASSSYSLFSDTRIVMTVPALGPFKQYSVAVRCFVPAAGEERESNLGFFDFVNARPVANLTGMPAGGNAPLDVTFRPAVDLDGSGLVDDYSFDPDGSPLVSYNYDFDNDGTDDISMATEADVAHQYPKKGTFTCKLTCVDVDGGQTSTTFDVVVGTELPIAKISANPAGGPAPFNASFDGQNSSDADGVIVKYEWDFDGNGTYDLDSGGTNKVGFWYNSPGNYNAVLRVTDNDGATDTDSMAITVQPGSGKPILVILNDDGLYPTNLDAIESDLDSLGAGYDVLPYYDTIADGFKGAGYKLAFWYRGGPGAPEESVDSRAWTDLQIDNYIKIQKDGGFVLLFSQGHGAAEGNEAAYQNGWSTFYRFNMQPDTLTAAQRRFSWASGLATDALVSVAGLPFSLATNPDSFTTKPAGTHFAQDSANCAEKYAGQDSSGQVPLQIQFSSTSQFCGLGFNSSLVAPEAKSSGFCPGLYIEPLFGGTVDAGALSWGNSKAPDENIGSAPNYSHTLGSGKLWVVSYPWAQLSITNPSPMSRDAMLQNMIAWFAPGLAP